MSQRASGRYHSGRSRHFLKRTDMQDPSPYIVIINFLVGMNIILASRKLGELAAIPFSRRPQEAARVTRIAYLSILTFGSSTAILMAAIYVLFHVLRIGV